MNLQLPFGVGLETLQLRERTRVDQVIKGKLDREIGIEGVKDVRFQVGDFGLQENSKSPTSPIARHGSDAETNSKTPILYLFSSCLYYYSSTYFVKVNTHIVLNSLKRNMHTNIKY